MKPTDATPSVATAPGAQPLEAAARPPLSFRLRAYRLLWIIAVTVFVCDQASKLWIVGHVPYDHSHGFGTDIEIIRGFFYIIHVGNTGAAWSMFSGSSVLLAFLAAATLCAIYFCRQTLGLKHRASQICFGLLCGGIAGNLVDRLVHHHVIDFVDLHFGTYVYPTFNVADSGICIGVLLYLVQSFRSRP